MKDEKINDRRNSQQNGKKRKNKKGNKNSNQRYREKDYKFDGTSKDGPSKDPRNDLSWYTHNPILTAASASIPFPYRPGMSMNLLLGDNDHPYYVPGILAIKYSISIGHSNSVTDPASLIAKEIYARVRSAFSGALDVDAPDLMMYVLALDSIYSQIAHLKRIYRILNTYTTENYLIPGRLLQALTGLSSDQVQVLPQYKVQLLSLITELVGMTNKFIAPGDMDIIHRHYWMNDNVYTDDNTANAQMYVFVPENIYKITIDEEITKLTSTKFSYNSTSTVDYFTQYYQFVRGLIEALANSSDGYTITGYFARAYQNGTIFTMTIDDIVNPFTPVYEPEVLSQIENLTVMSVTEGTLDVTQNTDTNAMVSVPTGTIMGMPQDSDWIPNPTYSIRSDIPGPGDVVIATRLKSALMDFNSGVANIYCGTEVVVGVALYNGNPTDSPLVFGQYYNILDTTESSALVYILRAWATLSAFDWAPICYLAITNADTSVDVIPFGDIHNFTVSSNNTLREINRVCLLSEFNAFG